MSDTAKETLLWRSPLQWSQCNSRVVAAGSYAQMCNVLEMAIQDLLAINEALPDDHPMRLRVADALIRFRHPMVEIPQRAEV